MPFGIAVIIGAFIATYLFFRALLHVTQDSKEPPLLEIGLPFISPLLGMRKKIQFYIDLRDKFNFPVYTLRIPFARIYIINSSTLISAAQRQWQVLDFAPLEARAGINVMGAGPDGQKILIRETSDGKKDYSYSTLFAKAVHPALSPGSHLDNLNRTAVLAFAKTHDDLQERLPTNVKLYEWTRPLVTSILTDAVYGPHNPFREKKVQQAFLDFEPGIITLLLNFAPTIFAGKSLRARTVIVEAFDHYFESGVFKTGSELVQAHYQHKTSQGARGKDIARFEIGLIVALLLNTIPASFWVLLHIVSDAKLLAKCREEVLACCTTSNNVRLLDMSRVLSSCKVLQSIFQECLRFHGIGTSIRYVMEDHVLDGKYLLKKGGIVMIPGQVQHTSEEAYGRDVNSFVPERFVRSSTRKVPHPASFRGFGGGTTLCPGRHFAMADVLGFVAPLIVRFDFTPVKGSWVIPPTVNSGMQGTIATPDHDVEVCISSRNGEEFQMSLKVFMPKSANRDELSAVADAQ